MVEEISREERKAAKPHQCFHCYRTIAKGEVHDVFTGRDDTIYTIRSHLDCQAAAIARITELMEWSDYWDGVPPLYDEMTDSGEFENECAYLRGRFPHVVTRMELNEQLGQIRHAARLVAAGIEPHGEDFPNIYG
ncbi:hypothetical protein [Citreimonas sp.]|uniref:hypothetical protein n=1 Tax=Citreimonas sp. TaxID=3036715 RepID=UPI0040592C09